MLFPTAGSSCGAAAHVSACSNGFLVGRVAPVGLGRPRGRPGRVGHVRGPGSTRRDRGRDRVGVSELWGVLDLTQGPGQHPTARYSLWGNGFAVVLAQTAMALRGKGVRRLRPPRVLVHVRHCANHPRDAGRSVTEPTQPATRTSGVAAYSARLRRSSPSPAVRLRSEAGVRPGSKSLASGDESNN